MLTVGLKGIKKETRFGRREKKLTYRPCFAFLCLLFAILNSFRKVRN